MKMGIGLGLSKKRAGPPPAATAPAAFTAGQWGWVTAGTAQATINILTLPSNGGSAITDLQYKIGAGAWTSFGSATTGSYTIGGFTDGVGVSTLVRAVNAIGSGPDSDAKTITSVAGTAPSAFTIEQWGVINFGSGTAKIGILLLPSAGSSPINRLDYRVAGGSWLTLTSAPTIADYTITGITDGAYRNIEIRAVSAAGASGASDVKKVWTGVGVMPQVAYYGAKTVQNGGCFRPLDHTGQPVNLTSSPAPVLVSGAAIAPYVATITTTGPGTGLTFNSGGAGAPAGRVFTVALAAGGTVDLEIQTIANMFHTASLQQSATAFQNGSCALGDQIRIRAGDHNFALAAGTNINRTSNTPGTWTGTGDIRLGNWLTFTRDPAHPTRIGAVQIGQGGNNYQRYFRVHNLEFYTPMTANIFGGSTNASAQLDFTGLSSSQAFFAATYCTFSHTETVTGRNIASAGNGNVGPHTAIRFQGGPYWCEGNRINGCFVGINAGTYDATQNSYLLNNEIRRAQIDGILHGTANNLIARNNLITDKVWPHFARVPTAVATGATTTFTVPNTTDIVSNELVTLLGFTGDFAQFNGRTETLSSFTGTTITVPINSTGLTWSGGGEVCYTAENHGDMWQFTESSGQQQNNVILEGNVLTRGFADGHWFPDGQGFFAGTTAGQPNRDNWTIRANIIEISLLRGISIYGLINSTVASNTVVRVLGLDGSSTTNQVAQIIIEGGSNNIYRDNLANIFDLAASAAENTNNIAITLSNPTSAIPALAGNVTLYESHFDNPPTVPDETYDGWVAYATRQSGGAQAGPIFAGATPYYNRATGVYSDPRA